MMDKILHFTYLHTLNIRMLYNSLNSLWIYHLDHLCNSTPLKILVMKNPPLKTTTLHTAALTIYFLAWLLARGKQIFKG